MLPFQALQPLFLRNPPFFLSCLAKSVAPLSTGQCLAHERSTFEPPRKRAQPARWHGRKTSERVNLGTLLDERSCALLKTGRFRTAACRRDVWKLVSVATLIRHSLFRVPPPSARKISVELVNTTILSIGVLHHLY